MKFYKILRQRKTKEENFCNLLRVQNYEYLKGNYPNSFAIKYNPDSYNKLLNNATIFKAYKKKSIQQLILTNQKFFTILNYIKEFNMEMVDCLFLEDESDIYLDEYDEISLEDIEDVAERYNFNIKEVTFTTNESQRMIILQKNGVIGIDEGLTDSEYEKLLNLIDTLNFGLEVIKT